MKNIKPVPWTEIQELIPPPSATEKEALRQSLARFGYRGPPVYCLPDHRIIDGHTRVELYNGNCPVEILDVDEATGRALALAHNQARRQLSGDQITEIRKRQRETALKLRAEGKGKITQQQAADAVGVTERTVRDWEKVMPTGTTSDRHNRDHRVKLTSAHKTDIVSRMKKGESQVTIAADYKVNQSTVSKLAKRDKSMKERQRKSADSIKQSECPPMIVLGDGRQHRDECDLLLTDPPYSTDADLNLIVPAIAEHLKRVKSTGRAFVFVGCYPAELKAYLNMTVPKHLVFEQILVWTYQNCIGPTTGRCYKTNWQPILHFVGEKAPKLRTDKLIELFSVKTFSAPDGRHGTRHFKWQKPDSLADQLIRHATDPGDTVFDPFAGSGTFLLAAARHKCKSIGYELERKTLNIALKNGCRLVQK